MRGSSWQAKATSREGRVKAKTLKNSGQPYRGDHQFRDKEGNRHGLFTVFWSELVIGKEGWYWFSGAYDNGNPIGPFDTSYMAYHDAVEMEPEELRG